MSGSKRVITLAPPKTRRVIVQAPKQATHTTAPKREKEPHEVLLACADAAVYWWAMKRPIQWSLEKHLQNATVNCVTSAEQELAKRVAAWCAIQGDNEAETV